MMTRLQKLNSGTIFLITVFIQNWLMVSAARNKIDVTIQLLNKYPFYQGQTLTFQSLVKFNPTSKKSAEDVQIVWALPIFISYKSYESQSSANTPNNVSVDVNHITMKFGSLGRSESINVLINVTVDPSAIFRDNRFHYATISTTVNYRWSDPCTKQENSNKVVHLPFFCPECKSFGAVGIENGTIKDSQIQTSTFQIYPPTTKSWVPMTSFLHLNTKRRMKLNFYQIDFRFSREFAMAVINGIPKEDPIPWNIIQLSSSEDAWKWKMLHAHQIKTTFSSHNSNEVSVAIAMSKPIKTRYLRISIPPFGNTNGNGQVFNVEVYVCNPNSFLPNQDTASPSPVGIESSSLVPDSRFSSPSSLGPQYQPRLGRLNTKVEGGSWCASTCSALHYLQIDLGETWSINEIENQGRYTTNGAVIAVKTYSLSSSLDGVSWTPYKNSEGTKIFWGNDVANFATRHKLSKPLTAKYVRFEPRTCTGNVACMRVELYGAKASAVQKVLPALFGRSMLLEPTKNVAIVCNTEVQKEKAHCFSSKDKGKTWREISVQVLSVVAFDSSEQRLYGLTRNGKNILKSKDPNGDQWRGIPLKDWYSVRDRSSVYTAVEIPFVPISRNVTNVIEPLIQMTVYNGDKWQADQVGVYYKPVGGTSKMVLSFLPYSPDLSSNSCHTGVCLEGTCEHLGGSRFKCHCMLGYTGRLCDTVFNYCSSNPCQNGGTCSSQFRSFICKCQPGYSGDTCQDYDECVSSPCLNGATCVDGDNKFTCTCTANYRGTTCQDFDECSSSPCQNGGTCTDGSSSYTCSCPTGYSGVNCQVTPCSVNPCKNGGTCVIKSGGGYSCKCDVQYSGTHCMNGRFVISRGARSSSKVWTYSSGKYDKIVFYSNANLTIFGVCLSDTHASSATCTHDTRIRKEGSNTILVSKSANIYCQRDDVYVNCPSFATPFLMVADTRYIIEVRMTSTKDFRKVVNGGLYASKTKTLSDGPLSFTYNYETVDSTELADSNGSTQSEGGIVGLSVQVAH